MRVSRLAGCWRQAGRASGAVVVAVLVALLFAAYASSAAAGLGQACGAASYRVALQSLTGPAGADLSVRVIRRFGRCALPETVSVEITISGGHRISVTSVAS